MSLKTHDHVTSVPSAESRVVIINCGTKWVTSLAVLSAHRHTGLPILVIDCESKDGSKRHLERIVSDFDIDVDWVDWPLRPHPVALDQLLKEIAAERLLLMDSDVEILSAAVFDAMRTALEASDAAYGSGFVHGPGWLGGDQGLPDFTGYYAERMWIPLVLLKVRPIRAALKLGLSFQNRRPYYEIPRAPRLSRLLGMRYRVAGLKKISFPRLGEDRPSYDGIFPKFIEFDTGADLHAHLQSSGRPFENIDVALWGDVSHHHGVTRAHLVSGVRKLAKHLNLVSQKTETDQINVVDVVKTRLRSVYGVREDLFREADAAISP
jgi:hypothetical protein